MPVTLERMTPSKWMLLAPRGKILLAVTKSPPKFRAYMEYPLYPAPIRLSVILDACPDPRSSMQLFILQ